MIVWKENKMHPSLLLDVRHHYLSTVNNQLNMNVSVIVVFCSSCAFLHQINPSPFFVGGGGGRWVSQTRSPSRSLGHVMALRTYLINRTVNESKSIVSWQVIIRYWPILIRFLLYMILILAWYLKRSFIMSPLPILPHAGTQFRILIDSSWLGWCSDGASSSSGVTTHPWGKS